MQLGWEVMVNLEWEKVTTSGDPESFKEKYLLRARIGNGWLVQSITGSITYVIGNERTSDADW